MHAIELWISLELYLSTHSSTGQPYLHTFMSAQINGIECRNSLSSISADGDQLRHFFPPNFIRSSFWGLKFLSAPPPGPGRSLHESMWISVGSHPPHSLWTNYWVRQLNSTTNETHRTAAALLLLHPATHHPLHSTSGSMGSVTKTRNNPIVARYTYRWNWHRANDIPKGDDGMCQWQSRRNATSGLGMGRDQWNNKNLLQMFCVRLRFFGFSQGADWGMSRIEGTLIHSFLRACVTSRRLAGSPTQL